MGLGGVDVVGTGGALKSGGLEPGAPSPNLCPCASPMALYRSRNLSASVPGAPVGGTEAGTAAAEASGGGRLCRWTAAPAAGMSGICW